MSTNVYLQRPGSQLPSRQHYKATERNVEGLLTSTSWLTPLAVLASVTRSSCILSTHDLILQKSEKNPLRCMHEEPHTSTHSNKCLLHGIHPNCLAFDSDPPQTPHCLHSHCRNLRGTEFWLWSPRRVPKTPADQNGENGIHNLLMRISLNLLFSSNFRKMKHSGNKTS